MEVLKPRLMALKEKNDTLISKWPSLIFSYVDPLKLDTKHLSRNQQMFLYYWKKRAAFAIIMEPQLTEMTRKYR